MGRLGRTLLSLFVLWHGLAVLASAGQDVPGLRQVRALTRGYELLLGSQQTWAMFAPPPKSTYWLRATGADASGAWHELPLLAGPPRREGVEWRYKRFSKLERNLANATRPDSRHRDLVYWLCRRQRAAGVDLQGVVLQKVSEVIPPPAKRRAGAPLGPLEWKEVAAIRCP